MRLRLGWFKRLGGGFGIGAVFGARRGPEPTAPVKVPAWPVWCLYAAVVLAVACVLLCAGGLLWNAATGG